MMQGMTQRFSALGLTLAFLLVTLISGCSTSSKVSEGDLYLEVKAKELQIQMLQKQLQAAKPKLTEVLPSLLTSAQEPPPGVMGNLIFFLDNNDCTDKQLSDKAKEACYKVTRVLLINTARELDTTSLTLYAGQRTVTQLVDILSGLIDTFSEAQ